jgi:hypothetical protein
VKKILLALFLVLPLAAIAQPVSPPAAPTQQVGSTVAPPNGQAATQNTIQTTGPVTSSTKIDVGTYAGQALMWVASIFGTTIGAALTALIIRLLKNAGFTGAEILRQKLQDMIVNGMNAGAREAADSLKDKGQIDIKNAVVASTVQYVQAHGADTLKQLGLDPTSPEAVAAIKARIETAINDPASPTPPVLDPTVAPKTA